MSFYTAYGLTFDSEIAIPEFLTTGETASCDVRIRFGETPASLTDARAIEPLYQINPTELLYRAPGIARYYVREGREINITPEPGSDHDGIRAVLLTSVLAGLMHQRTMFPLRASAVETPKGTVLFVGNSSIGKSTLAGVFVKKGCKLLHDNITPLQLSADGRLVTYGGYPTLKLWWLTTEYLGIAWENLRPFRPDWGCYLYPVGDQFTAHTSEIARIYLITNPTAPRPPQITAAHKAFIFLNFIYRKQFALQMGIIPSYWKLTGALENIPLIQVARSYSFNDEFEATVNQIESECM